MNHEQGKIKILKFGGSSVGSVERIKHVARLISDEQPKVVVLSAMSGTTDALAGIAAKLSGGDMDGALGRRRPPGKQVFGGRRRALPPRRKRGKGEKTYPKQLFAGERNLPETLFRPPEKKSFWPRGN